MEQGGNRQTRFYRLSPLFHFPFSPHLSTRSSYFRRAGTVFQQEVKVKTQVLSDNTIRWFSPGTRLCSQPVILTLLYAVCKCRRVVSNVFQLDLWSLQLLWHLSGHKRHMHFLTSAPNFRGSAAPSDPAFPSLCPLSIVRSSAPHSFRSYPYRLLPESDLGYEWNLSNCNFSKNSWQLPPRVSTQLRPWLDTHGNTCVYLLDAVWQQKRRRKLLASSIEIDGAATAAVWQLQP